MSIRISLTDWLPSRQEVSQGVGDVAGHAQHDGPFTAQVFDHDGRQEHGGDDDGAVDDAQRGHAHPLLCIQTALHTQGHTEALLQDSRPHARTVSYSYPQPLWLLSVRVIRTALAWGLLLVKGRSVKYWFQWQFFKNTILIFHHFFWIEKYINFKQIHLLKLINIEVGR